MRLARNDPNACIVQDRADMARNPGEAVGKSHRTEPCGFQEHGDDRLKGVRKDTAVQPEESESSEK